MKVRHGVLFSAIAVLLSVPGLTSAVLAADHPPLERDFFGTVVSVEDGFVLVQTDEGVVEVPVSDSTHVRSRVNPEGNVADLVAGDSIALSLTDGTAGLVADRILVIPGKTSIRHIPGVVIGLSDSEVIIRPVGAAGAISLGRPPDDDVQFHGGATGLTEGSTIILVAESSPQTGDLLLDEVQLHVTQTAEAVDLPENEPSASAGDAIVRGSFQRIDGEGRWVIDGTPVTVNAATTVTGAVVVGQPLSIEAMLTADGSLVARHVEPVDAASEASERTLFLGAFQGVDVDGRWIVAGTPIQVDSSSDTDGLPPLGELVKVNAVLTTGGVLVVREIESRPTGTGQRVTGAEVNGTFQGIASDGKWNVGGTVVTISPETQLSGAPAVGQRVKVGADVDEDGSLIARKVEGPQPRTEVRGTRVEIAGAVDEVRDGALIVNGISVAISPLTEIDEAPRPGDFVTVEAVVTSAGAVTAREVSSPEFTGAAEKPGPSPVGLKARFSK